MKHLLAFFITVLVSFYSVAQYTHKENIPYNILSSIVPSFTAPDTVCVNSPVSVVNTSQNATTYNWNFCSADLSIPPSGVNLGNIGGSFFTPVSVDYAFYNNNYYGFVVNYDPGGLTRLDFGNSLLNTPTAVSLGNFGGIIPAGQGAHGIQVVQNEGKWYAIIVGGYNPVGSTPRILKIDFGANLANLAPVATNWGNIGNMFQPIDLHIFKENNIWYGFTVSAENNTITRFNFTNSFDNVPTGVNLGNIGNLSYPNGIFSINDNGNWRVFIVNGGDRTRTGDNYSLTRLDFGGSLLNTPVGTNLGNPGGLLRFPVDITILDNCDQTVGYVVNGDPRSYEIVRLDFNNLLSATPVATSLGNLGNLNFPHSISKLFRVNGNVYSFITNAYNNTVTRLEFSGCNSPTLPGSNLFAPPAISYTTPGRYSINLTIDEGLNSQASFCKEIIVLARPVIDPLADITVCPGNSADIKATTANATKYQWSPATGLSASNVVEPLATPTVSTIYTLTASNAGCSATDDLEVKVLTPQQCIPPTSSFTAPDTVCVNSPVSVANTSQNATTYNWNFCAADLTATPAAVNLGNIGGYFSDPMSIDYALYNNNYYGFVVNYDPGGLTRLDFGNSLLNTPTAVSLGNFGGIIPAGQGAHGIQIVQNEGKWYAIIVGGYDPIGSTPRILKIDFGANLTNLAPVATNWGNIGNMFQPMDLHIFKENNIWYGFTVSSENNTITRFNFTTSFDNVPTGVNLGNIGNLSYPNGIFSINDNGNWRVFIVNGGDRTRVGNNYSLTRLDFGGSLLNTPVGTNLGNPGGLLRFPVDITILDNCDQTVGYVVNGDPRSYEIVRLDFNNMLSATPIITGLGNLGNLDFPHSISKLFRVNGNIYSFITNAHNNTITRLEFAGCNSPTLPGSNLFAPPPVSYTTPGRYSINLTVDEGLISQASFCKEIIVLPMPSVDYSFEKELCDPKSVKFINESTTYATLSWDFNNGTLATTEEPVVVFDQFGNYAVKLRAVADGGCADSVTKVISISLKFSDLISGRDTVACYNGSPFIINTLPALKYCWSPVPDPENTSSSIVIPGLLAKTTYYVNALVEGVNLVKNGDFSLGNSDFGSAYIWSNVSDAGTYAVRSTVLSWNPNLNDCKDHTGNSGNMMMVNGADIPDVKVWSQTISITPNTNYAFSTWLQSLWPANPARLQFSINGKLIGPVFEGGITSCEWNRSYVEWNSGSQIIAEIAIINQNAAFSGNDFALDDISFAEIQLARDSMAVTIHDVPEIDFNYNIPFCKALQLTGTPLKEPSPLVRWEWNFGDSEKGEAPALTHNFKAGGSYTIKVVATDQNACRDSAEKVIQLDTIKALVSADTMVCKNAPISLRGSGGSLYEWTPAGLLNNAGVAEPEALVTETTRFYLKIKNGIQCEDTASVLVMIKPRPEFTKPADRNICADSSIQLKSKNGSEHLYRWSPSASLDDPYLPQPIARPPATTDYNVSITEATCGYDTSFTVRVAVNPNPTVGILKQRDIDCINPTAPLTARGTGQGYYWEPSASVDFSNRPLVTVSVDSTTTFIVKNTNEFNCSAYASVIVKVTNTAKPVFVVPNAFTPNNDGANDCFGIKHWGNVTIHEFSIFNRWGERVFTTKNPRDCWNGMYKGRLQPAGGFVYTIRATSFCGELVRKGSLILVR
ncbi:MAG: gliding motility-associated C-terminal domain-containing protein [Chitinophagaceae bacterium]|nr:gliding motility-associated C-terminal domain-containing protein [Chitinophagaceae bacterium]